jgi:2-dehydropantoate 2-reductase
MTQITIFGTGGVGGNYGAYLARAGAAVTFIARGAHLQAMREHGLRIESETGDFTVKPVKVTDDPSSIKNSDVILVCTKTWQLESIIDDLKSMVRPDTIILPLLNSVEAADFLAEKLGRKHVLGGLCYTISWIKEAGVIKSGGPSLIILGELSHTESERVKNLAKLLDDAPGIKAQNVANIRVHMWKKFSWISCAGAVGAATRSPSGLWWRQCPETRELFETLLRESFTVAKAYGAELSKIDRDEIIDYLDKRADAFRTSMQRDIESGRRSELMQQIGATMRLADKVGISVPASAAIYAALLPLELRAQGKISYS